MRYQLLLGTLLGVALWTTAYCLPAEQSVQLELKPAPEATVSGQVLDLEHPDHLSDDDSDSVEPGFEQPDSSVQLLGDNQEGLESYAAKGPPRAKERPELVVYNESLIDGSTLKSSNVITTTTKKRKRTKLPNRSTTLKTSRTKKPTTTTSTTTTTTTTTPQPSTIIEEVVVTTTGKSTIICEGPDCTAENIPAHIRRYVDEQLDLHKSSSVVWVFIGLLSVLVVLILMPMIIYLYATRQPGPIESAQMAALSSRPTSGSRDATIRDRGSKERSLRGRLTGTGTTTDNGSQVMSSGQPSPPTIQTTLLSPSLNDTSNAAQLPLPGVNPIATNQKQPVASRSPAQMSDAFGITLDDPSSVGPDLMPYADRQAKNQLPPPTFKSTARRRSKPKKKNEQN